MKIIFWRIALSGIALLLLAGCGNKGPLYLPDAEPVMQPPADDTAGQTDE